MKFTIEKYAARMEASQNRGRTESATQTFLGGDGPAQGQSPKFGFLQDVLPRLIPDTLGGEADERK